MPWQSKVVKLKVCKVALVAVFVRSHDEAILKYLQPHYKNILSLQIQQCNVSLNNLYLTFNAINMNRLVIIGNGFDLAHGLPTSYGDFVNFYWKSVANTDHSDSYVGFHDATLSFTNITCFKDIVNQIASNLNKTLHNDEQGIYFDDFDRNTNPPLRFKHHVIIFKKFFFNVVNHKHRIENWVDVENIYYHLLKKCLLEEDSNFKVKKLNEEFEEVRLLLENYLIANVDNQFDFSNVNTDILDLFKNKPLGLRRIHNQNPSVIPDYLKEFPKEDQRELKRFDDEIINGAKPLQLNLFLNFNYTKTIEAYIDSIKILDSDLQSYFGNITVNQIHGKLQDDTNIINFGFGDEMDDDYKTIENKDDNEYLKNIKSFKYFLNSNYRDMLEFLESGKFQVWIMGHSCGLSDRILLNKIFEHEFCRSIKVFYHKYYKPKEDGRTDDYTNIVQNISRHFNKKELMRERIVNKSLCQPLPQIQLPLKQ